MELHFLRPYWFLMILPMLFLCWRLSKNSLVDSWRSVCDEHLLKHLLVMPQRKITLPIVLLIIASVIAVFALAGPSFERQAEPIYRSMLGRVLVLNLSPSMADSVGTTKKIDRARFKILDYLNREKEGLTGLVIYTDEAYTIAPLTEDNHTIANFVPSLDTNIMPTFNDDTTVGLKEAEKLLRQAGLNHGDIVLVTDKITNYNKSKQLAKALFDEGYRLYIYDISDQSGSNTEMEKLAALGGGNVIPLSPNNNDIEWLLKKTAIPSMVKQTKKTSEKGYFWRDDGRVVVFFLLPFALLGFRRGYL